LPGGSGYGRSISIVELKFDARGFVYPMHELSTGLNGTASTLRTASGAYIGYEWFDNPKDQNLHPLSKDMYVRASGLRTEWEIIQGRSNSRTGSEFVSIQAVHKPGLFITAASLSATRLTHDSYNANLRDAQTFRTIQGQSGGVRFESLIYPGRFLTSQSGRLTLTDGSNAAASTFSMANAAADPYLPMPTANYPFDAFAPQQ